jgi:FMN hydrolase / 5-amino-6-(5-phospho-D-ribitylamino)uracil phosphatase
MPIRAVTLDLDDTLWPFAPVAARIEAALSGFLRERAPRTAARFDAAAAHEVLAGVRRERTDLAHDLGATRREALRRMLATAGDDPALVEPAFAVAFEARQRVELYPDVVPALDRLAARFPLLAVTNGNADVERIGVRRWFAGVVSAAELGVAKPDPRIFHAACERLALAPDAVLHGGDDLEADVHGALRAGLRAAWVHRDLRGEAPADAMRTRDLAALADRLGA